MKNTSKDLWLITYEWLLQCGNKLNSNYTKEEITTHPDYPTLISVVDFLDNGGLEYKVVQADASYIHEFNYPLLAHIKQPGQEYMHLVNSATSWDIEKEITQHWSGIAIYLERNTQWHNGQNNIYQQNEEKNKLIAFAFSTLGFVLLMISTFQHPNIFNNLFGLLSLLGLIVSIYLLGTELGFQSQIVKQVCGAVSNGGCEKVLKSSYAKGVAGITPADASVLYFAAQFIVYLLSGSYPVLSGSILLLAFSGIAVAAWSIYTQTVKLKQYCALCLTIVAVLVLQSITALFIVQHYKLNEISIFIGLGSFIALSLVLALVLLPIKQLIKTNGSNKLKLTELKKWKLDADLFINQWQQEEEVDTTVWENDLLLGSPSAPLLITVACNPYCGPCAKAHKQLDDLLLRFASKLKVQIRLLCNPENETDQRTIAVKAILQKGITIKNNSELQQMLADWFEWMDYKKWNDKWQPDSRIDINQRIKQHQKWIENSAIAFTPTIFINGKKLPGRYSLDDIEILIHQLAEQIIV